MKDEFYFVAGIVGVLLSTLPLYYVEYWGELITTLSLSISCAIMLKPIWYGDESSDSPKSPSEEISEEIVDEIYSEIEKIDYILKNDVLSDNATSLYMAEKRVLMWVLSLVAKRDKDGGLSIDLTTENTGTNGVRR